MPTGEKTQSSLQTPANALSEVRAAWVNDAVSRMKRLTAAETDISRGIAQLIDASLGAAVLSQKDFAKATNDAISSNDPVMLMMLPQKFLHAAIRDSLENSARTLQYAQTLFSQIHAAALTSDEGDSRKT
ncbi:hypothetical protein [Tabrizicola sp.]|uniref:hypothetical protein n=1 Tax=Tabrizicola sp. TaxID=2005166 RepID=UPI003F37EE7C